jgi:anti-anti-sigma factor
VNASITVQRRNDGAAVLVVRGDLDAASGAELRGAIAAAVAEWRPPAMVIDVGLVTFVDSAGAGALIAGYKAAKAVGVVDATGTVGKTLRRMGLARLFGVDAGPEGSVGGWP